MEAHSDSPVADGDLYHAIAGHCQQGGDHIAIRAPFRDYSYSELVRKIDEIAERLVDHGVGRGDVVVVDASLSPAVVASYVAVNRVGAAFCPVDAQSPELRKREIVASAEPNVVMQVVAGEISETTVSIHKVAASPRRVEPSPEARRLAYVMYTSGTTGRPKGVEVHRSSLGNVLAHFATVLPMGTGNVMAALTPISFDISILELLLPLVTGGTVAFLPGDTTYDRLRSLGVFAAIAHVDTVQATPAAWQMLIDMAFSAPQLRAICGGDRLGGRLAEELQRRFSAAYNGYGPTETAIYSSLQRLDSDDTKGPVRIGRPISNTSFAIWDQRGKLVLGDGEGELHIAGQGVAVGYRSEAQLTAERFVELNGRRWYRTGDLVRRRGKDYTYVGRMDRQVKILGHRVEPSEVEVFLERMSWVKRAVVVVEGAEDQRHLVGYCEAATTASEHDLEQAMQSLREVLPAYSVPAKLHLVDTLPLSSHLKFVAPQALEGSTPVDQVVASCWSEVLGRPIDEVYTSDFFALGGSSLLAVRLAAELGDRLGIEVSIRDVFSNPSVRQMQAAISLDRLEPQPSSTALEGFSNPS